MKKFFVMAALAAVTLVTQAQAAILTINVSPLDLKYDSVNHVIYDATSSVGGNGNSAEADPLGAMTFSLTPGGFQGVITTNIFADVFLQLAGPIIMGNDIAITGGYFDLITSLNVPGWGAAIDITSGSVKLTDTGVSISFGGNAAGADCPVCANTLGITGPYTVTFSSQAVTFTNSQALEVGNFTSVGSADISGTAVPEPSTYAMIGGALLSLGMLRRRKA